MELVKLLVPIHSEAGEPLHEENYPVLQPAPDTPLVDRVRAVLADTFDATVVRLERYARRLAGGSDEPLYLLLSAEEGGFARQGFWLAEAGARRFLNVPYVDLAVTNDHAVDSGYVESTFAHEMGHVIVRHLLGDTTRGMARKPHLGLVVTDYPTALDEGFAIHFEALVRDHTANPELLGTGRRKKADDLIGCWLGNVDGAFRQDGVRRNLGVFRKALLPSALDPDADPYDRWRDDETSTAFVPGELKTGQEMMASEAVGATLFYRWMTSKRLQERREDAAFYQRFGAVADDVSLVENAMLKVLAALYEVGRRPFEPGRPLLVELAEAYAALFPADAWEVLQLFMETTWGATVSPALSRKLGAIARAGRLGRMEFVGQFRPAFAELSALVDEVLEARAHLGDGLGPELWRLNPALLVALRNFGGSRSTPFALNLNTATEVEWMTVPGVDVTLARRIVAARSACGYFRSVEDLATVPGVTADLVAQVANMGQVEPIHRI
jgi:hypothetical protein